MMRANHGNTTHAALVLAALLSACGQSHEQVGTQSNWLRCEADSECESLSCLCGICSHACETEGDCVDLDARATCTRPETGKGHDGCGSTPPPATGMLCALECETDADCMSADGSTQCAAGICVAMEAAPPAGAAPPDTGEALVVDPNDRYACLRAPWVPAPDDPDVQSVQCSALRQTGFELPGTTEATFDQVRAFLDAHRSKLHALSGVTASGAGLCCDGWAGPDARCVSVGITLCTLPVSTLAARMGTWKEADPEAADLSIKVRVDLNGVLDPRCPPGECGPVPYEEPDRPYVGNREVIEARSVDGPACTDDGECLTAGCGNGCFHWTSQSAGLPGTCPYYPELTNAFCGCAEGRCAWFE